MIRTNLANSRKKSRTSLLFGKVTRKKKNFSLVQLIKVVIAVAIGFLPVFFIKEYKKWIINKTEEEAKKLEEKISDIDSEIKKLIPFEKELETYEKQKEIVQTKIDTLSKLFSIRTSPVFILDTISEKLPRKAWLDSLQITMKDGYVIQIEGDALTSEDVSDYVDKLRSSVHLSDIRLEEVQNVRSQEGNYEVKKFKIAAHGTVQFSSRESEKVQ